MFKRLFLRRRRYDTVALALAFGFLATFDNASKTIFALFVFAGAYLCLARHRSVLNAPLAFCAALFAYGAWSIALTLARGEPFVGNRQLGFGLIAVCFAFFPMGLVLVARPLRAAVSGARIAVLLVTLLAVIEYAMTGDRVGLGANVALFAFVVAALGILAGTRTGDHPRLLPDTRLWFYLSFVPVVLSQTRAAWAVYALALVIDLVRLAALRPSLVPRARLPVLAAALGVVALAAVPAWQIFEQGLERGLAQYEAYSSDVRADTSVGIRMAMWEGAIAATSQSPLVGVGAASRIDIVAERMPASGDVLREFAHLHNLVLDEMLSNGLVGLALMLLVFATAIVTVLRGTREASLREACILLIVLVFTFGSFHGVMLNETTLFTMFAVLSVLQVELRRDHRRNDEGVLTRRF